MINFDLLGGYQTGSQYSAKYSRQDGHEPVVTLVPENVLALTNKDVSVQGFMVPLEVPDAKVKTFLLVADRASCCFGGPPKLTHRIYVSMRDDRWADFYPDNVVTVRGVFRVTRDSIDEETLSIYEIDADDVSVKK